MEMIVSLWFLINYRFKKSISSAIILQQQHCLWTKLFHKSNSCRIRKTPSVLQWPNVIPTDVMSLKELW